MHKKNLLRSILVFLLLILAIIMRLSYQHPHHPDHFTWGQYTNALLEYNYAPWVLHPTSLFGYYPLSFPSGFEFFFAYLSTLTGLALPQLFYYLSIFFGLFGGFTLFVLMRRWTSFETSFLTSLILMTMAFYSLVTANTASSRIFNIIFYPLFILSLFTLYEVWEKKKRIGFRYIFLSIIFFLMMSLIHRLSQLSIIFIASFILAFCVKHYKPLLEKYQKTVFYKRRKHFYDRSKLYVAVDLLVFFITLFGILFIKSRLFLVGFLFFTIYYYYVFNLRRIRSREEIFIDFIFYISSLLLTKAGDLLTRGRFLVQLSRLFPGITWSSFVILGFLLAIIGVSFYLIHHTHFHRLLKHAVNITDTVVHHLYGLMVRYPEESISIGLFMIFIIFLLSNFTGRGILDIDTSYYQTSFLIKGEGSLVLLNNFLLNLNNNLTILIWFSLIGLLYVFLTRIKTFYHYFFMFVAIFFSQFIFDWEYVRLFMNPVYAIFIGLGISFVLKKTCQSYPRFKRIAVLGFILIFSLHFLFANIFMHRDYFLQKMGIGEVSPTLPEKHYLAAGRFLAMQRHALGDISLLSSAGTVRHQHAAYYAKIPEAVVAQSIYTQKRPYNITRINAGDIVDDVKHGKKIRQFFTLQDWLIPGRYYHGRHIAYLLGRNYDDKLSKRIIKDYHIRYIMDGDIAVQRNTFFSSMKNMKNKVFATSSVSIYDIERGK